MPEDFLKIVFYVIIGIIYLLSQIKKGRKKDPVTRQPAPTSSGTPARMPSSTQPSVQRDFKKPQRTPVKPLIRKQQPASIEEIVSEYDAEGKMPDKRKATVNRPKPVTEPLRKSYAPVQDLRKGSILKPVQETEKQDKRPVTENKYAAMLRSPHGARTAFVMAEIFNRKY